jgi:hypothetical protein
MSNMITAKVSIRGVRPLLIHHFGEDAIPADKSVRKEKTGAAGNDPEEWRRTALINKHGQLYVEPTYIFGTLRDGAKHTPKGRGSLQPAVAATLQIDDAAVLIDRFFPGFPSEQPFDIAKAAAPPRDPNAPVYMDVRSVKNPATRARNVRYRVACSPGWTCGFTILFDKTVVTRGQMEAVLRDAGQLVGLADGRSIGFGRFTVEGFAETES